ncbi:MAG: type II secretion system F family protein [Candidatus Omnitrophica bacterium]|nr:type II secretion system F family protein [Candidatus Omnitrophota bacterium]
MPRFTYAARNYKGEKITGTEEASGQEEVVGRLQSRNLLVVSVVADENPSGSSGLLPKGKVKIHARHYGISKEDMVLFCRQLATLLGAGVTILKSLDIISEQVASKKLYNIIKDMQKNMQAGLSLHEAMAKHPQVFSELWVNLVESGEASGNLALILNRLAGYLERISAFRSKIISALIYPIILMAASIGALLFLTLKIIPTFAELFKGFGTELPTLTKAIVMVSYLLRKNIGMILICLTVLVYVIRRYIRSPNGRKRYEKLLLSLPLIGKFFNGLLVERFSSEMSTLVESGVPILYSLEITERSVNNPVLADIIRDIKENVREGKPLSQPMERSRFFEPMVVQMVAIGEEIGELSQMFKKINTFYQEYVETFLSRITAMFEPIMLIFMALVIGIMVIGMFLPIFQIAQLGGR